VSIELDSDVAPDGILDARAPAPKLRGERSGEGGYVLALAALLMLPLLAFTGFAVDLGSWYSQAARTQKAADAAALAGVTQLPDFPAAVAVARDVAARNGYTHGQDGVTVTVEDLGNQRLRVEIADGNANQYFTSVFTDEVTITRGAQAEFVLPVAMGSPRNYLGTGQLFDGAYRENLWLALNGPCSGREQGDWLSPRTGATFNDSGNPPAGGAGWGSCLGAGTFVNDGYDPNGYYFGIAVPEGYAGGSLNVKLYDAARCASGVDFGGGADAFPTQFRLLGHDNSPWDPTNNPPLATRVFETGDHCGTEAGGCGPTGSWRERWCNFATIPDPQPGELYFLQVRTSGFPEGEAAITTGAQHMINSFAVAVTASGGDNFPTTQACSGDPHDNIPHNPTCPQVYAFNYLPVFANFAGTTPSFFLAEIGPEHSNKELVVDLFDIGEGTGALEILDPNGDPITFDYTIVDESGSDIAPTGGWSGTTDNLDVLGTPGAGGAYCRGSNPQQGPRRTSASKYNDRIIRVSVDLPADIQAAYGGATWWRIRYTMCTGGGGSPSDRTTWNAQIIGDPVRLIN
jgi:Flp pilus assembly protein TadG